MTLISNEDFEELNKYYWYQLNKDYIRAIINKKAISIHRQNIKMLKWFTKITISNNYNFK